MWTSISYSDEVHMHARQNPSWQGNPRNIPIQLSCSRWSIKTWPWLKTARIPLLVTDETEVMQTWKMNFHLETTLLQIFQFHICVQFELLPPKPPVFRATLQFVKRYQTFCPRIYRFARYFVSGRLGTKSNFSYPITLGDSFPISFYWLIIFGM